MRKPGLFVSSCGTVAGRASAGVKVVRPVSGMGLDVPCDQEVYAGVGVAGENEETPYVAYPPSSLSTALLLALVVRFIAPAPEADFSSLETTGNVLPLSSLD